MVQQADDHVDVCCQISDEAVAADLTDTTMFGTTSLLSFFGLVENVPIDAVVNVMYNIPRIECQPYCCHRNQWFPNM